MLKHREADTKAALQRAYNLVKHLQSGVPLRSMRLISSPACRCLETILMAGDEFGGISPIWTDLHPGMDRAEVLEQLLAGHKGTDLLQASPKTLPRTSLLLHFMGIWQRYHL